MIFSRLESKGIFFLKSLLYNSRQISNKSCIITKVHRAQYLRSYPTMLVLPNGSTIAIRYEEPRKIIKLPLDLTTLTEEERRERIEKRKPKTRVKIEEDIEDNFSAQKYLKYMKKKK